jgi:hypothetical protein
MSVSRQKVSAAMRKAGLKAAVYNRSGMVRGWGDWSSGVRVVDAGERGVQVYFQRGRWANGGAEIIERDDAKIRGALTAAGLEFSEAAGYPGGMTFTVTGLRP